MRLILYVSERLGASTLGGGGLFRLGRGVGERVVIGHLHVRNFIFIFTVGLGLLLRGGLGLGRIQGGLFLRGRFGGGLLGSCFRFGLLYCSVSSGGMDFRRKGGMLTGAGSGAKSELAASLSTSKISSSMIESSMVMESRELKSRWNRNQAGRETNDRDNQVAKGEKLRDRLTKAQHALSGWVKEEKMGGMCSGLLLLSLFSLWRPR